MLVFMLSTKSCSTPIPAFCYISTVPNRSSPFSTYALHNCNYTYSYAMPTTIGNLVHVTISVDRCDRIENGLA